MMPGSSSYDRVIVRRPRRRKGIEAEISGLILSAVEDPDQSSFHNLARSDIKLPSAVCAAAASLAASAVPAVMLTA